MSEDIKLSVVLSVCNAEKYLKKAIESILVQQFEGYEFLIINDGSTDASKKIINEYAKYDSRIVVIDRENRGLVSSLNEGVAKARANIVARMDADDIAMPNRFSIQMAYLNSHPDCVCVGSDIELIDEQGRKLVVWNQPLDDADIQRGALQGHTTICHPSAMFRKDAFLRVGGYRAEMYPAEDLDLWLRLGEVGTLANVSPALLRYRMVAQSISGRAGKDGRQREAGRRASDEACLRRGLKTMLFEAYEQWRPDGTASAQLRNDLIYGWWAFGCQEFGTATSYGWKAWRSSPTSREALTLVFKSLQQRLFNKV